MCFRKLDSRAIIKSTSAVLGTFRPFSPKARSAYCLSLRKVYLQSVGTCVLRSAHSLQGPSGLAHFTTTLSAMYPAMYTSTFPSWSKAGDDCTEGLVSRSRTTSLLTICSHSEVAMFFHDALRVNDDLGTLMRGICTEM